MIKKLFSLLSIIFLFVFMTSPVRGAGQYGQGTVKGEEKEEFKPKETGLVDNIPVIAGFTLIASGTLFYLSKRSAKELLGN